MFNVVSEAGLYTLILSSRKPEARTFRRWITHDVIPSIRKHGAYIVPELLAALTKSEDRQKELIAELEADRASIQQLQEVYARRPFTRKLCSEPRRLKRVNWRLSCPLLFMIHSSDFNSSCQRMPPMPR